MKIRTKLIFSFLAVAMLVAIVGWVGISSVNRIKGLRDVEIPIEQNLKGVEVNIWETIHAADAFRLTGDPFYAELYKTQISDVSEFYSKYVELTTSAEEQTFIEEFNKLWEEAKVAGEKMIALTREEQKTEGDLFQYIRKTDDIIHFEIKAKWSRNDPYLLAKESVLSEIEESLWKTIHAAIQYKTKKTATTTVGHDEETFKEIMYRQFDNIEENWTKYKALASSAWEKKAISNFDVLWSDSVEAAKKLVELNEEAAKQSNILYEKVDRTNQVIHFKMENFIQKRIEKENANVRTTVFVSIMITIISFLLALGLGIYISRSISNQLTKLRDAAVDISHGNMEAKINVSSNNEIGEMADAFDNMRTSLKIMMEKYDIKN